MKKRVYTVSDESTLTFYNNYQRNNDGFFHAEELSLGGVSPRTEFGQVATNRMNRPLQQTEKEKTTGQRQARNRKIGRMTSSKKKRIKQKANKSVTKTIGKFLESTTIHGLSDLVTADNWLMKFIWVVIMLFCLSIMCLQLAWLFQNVRDEPTLSRVGTTVPRKFPQFVYCPAQWQDPRRMAALGLGHSSFDYLDALLIHPAKQLHNHSDGRAVLDLQNVVTQLGSIDAVFRAIAYDLADVIIGTDPIMHNASRIITHFGMCYRMQNHDTYTTITIGGAKTMFEFRQYTGGDDNKADYDLVDKLIVGDVGDCMNPSGEIYLQRNTYYNMQVSYWHFFREPTRKKPCRHDMTHKSMVECYMLCAEKMCSKARLCTTYLPGANQSNLADLCTLNNPESHCLLTVLQDEIEERCAKDCEWNTVHSDQLPSTDHHTVCPYPLSSAAGDTAQYEDYRNGTEGNVTVSDSINGSSAIESFINTNRTIVRISYSDPLNSMSIEEHLLYSTTITLSNVGGIMSLWFGASVLSLAQIVLYFIAYPFSTNKAVDSTLGKIPLGKKSSFDKNAI